MNQTVLQLIRQVESGDPRRLAGQDLDGRTITLGELSSRSNRVANALEGAGLRRGASVAYIARNRLEYMEIEWGIAKAGLARLPLYHQLSLKDIERAVALTGARVMIADSSAAQSGVLDQIRGQLSHPIVLGAAEGWTSYEPWIAQASANRTPSTVAPSDPFHIRMTSGSSGQPKGVVISHLAARTAMLGNMFILNSEGHCTKPRTLQQAPVTLASGWTVLPTLLSRGVNVFTEKFDPQRAVDVIIDNEITWTMVVPTMLRMMVARSSNLERLRDSSLQCLVYGGEPPPTDVMGEILDHTDSLVQVYGQTEAPSWTTYLSRQEHSDPDNWASCGRAVPGVEIGILVGDSVQTRATGPGEFVIRGANIASDLLGGGDEYERRQYREGWWRTGDTAVIDEDGRLTLVGRESEMIIRGGSNVHPSEIERVLGAHPGVNEVVVVGVRDSTWGEIPVALVSSTELVGEAGATELQVWAAASLARYKQPAEIYVQRDALPRLGVDAKVSKLMAKQEMSERRSERRDEAEND